MSRPARLLTSVEVSAIKSVRTGESVAAAAASFGLTKKLLCYIIAERLGGVASLRRSNPSDDLLDRLTRCTEIDLPKAEPDEVAEEPRQTSPFAFPHAVHREDQLARVREFRRGASGYRDLTGALLGDPPVGRSALDLRRKGRAA